MRSNGCRTVLLLTPPLLVLFPLTAITTILERVSKSIFQSNVQRGYSTGDFQTTLSRPGTNGDIDVALDINNGPTYAILGLCVVAYAIALLGGAGIWQLRRVEGTAGHERMWVWIVLLSNLVMAAGSLAVFGYATAAQTSDGTWQSYRDAGDPSQEHTRETWACQINEFFPNEGWAASACGTAKAMRYFLLPMAVAALAVLGSLWVLVRSRGGIKWMFGGKGRYAGFRGAYEMHPHGTQGQYAGPPAVQWVQQPWAGQPVQQWQGQPGQQWMAQPYQQWGPQPVQQWGPQTVQQSGPQPPQQWGPQTVVQAPPKLDTPVFR